jgi:hypothetical protein
MWWWRRSDLVTGASSGELYCDGRTGVDGDGELRMILSTKKGSRRCTSSPGGFLGSRRRRLSMKNGAVSPIPASICERERSITDGSDLPSPIPFSGRFKESRRSSRACRRRSGWSLATARKSAGARVSIPAGELEEREELGLLGLSAAVVPFL